MKTFPLEQLGERLSEVLAQQPENESLRLTKDACTIAFLLRLPETMKDAEAKIVSFNEGPAGRVNVVVEARHAAREDAEQPLHRPIFGAGRGTLTTLSDDDDYLKDFEESMG